MLQAIPNGVDADPVAGRGEYREQEVRPVLAHRRVAVKGIDQEDGAGKAHDDAEGTNSVELLAEY